MALYSQEGWGKTSFAAQFPAPIFLMAAQETGLLTLIDNSLLGPTPHLPPCNSWVDLKAMIRALIDQEHGYKTLVIDTLNGVERLCHEYVCEKDFNGDWGEKGFLGFHKGFEISLGEWRDFLDLLDQLRLKRGVRPLLLIHSKVTTFKNPEGPDFDKYQPEMHAKTWALTHKWLDMVLFGQFQTMLLDETMKKSGSKTKALNTELSRVLNCEHRASYDAKNRLGLPAQIELGNSPAEAFRDFVAAVKQAQTDNKAAMVASKGVAA